VNASRRKRAFLIGAFLTTRVALAARVKALVTKQSAPGILIRLFKGTDLKQNVVVRVGFRVKHVECNIH
jgi:hypothetical protein